MTSSNNGMFEPFSVTTGLVLLITLALLLGVHWKRKLARPKLGVRVVMISDTHGRHRDLTNLPEADILIHAGDWTHFGKEENARDFNEWLGALSQYQHKIVVNGNHEHNAEWKGKVQQILSNAIFLRDEETTIRVKARGDGAGADVPVQIWGTEFFWPMTTPNPHYAQIPNGCDIIICHGPCKDRVDGGRGCQSMLSSVRRVGPRLVVSGHIHHAHGVVEDNGTVFVNAANANHGYSMGWDSVVVDL
mmetsp:Transcript_49159/g.100350  ORF Transcript_49159/g.100350 Transcript_49159/m.100350 type:complete len:247 (+) Transcript_49159:149-889(+)|eukprot:CAMPEP_0181310238 /NCGR_PEP_ID=MMETSP1101-20121128/12477_1 /TAXON_ID=46948 /ORGANISM="Rhodomonas abbreviata, Strain Caron Lab Isolate" /LENGTH=246 /DNA_ID=CAMNT_0023416849 /DNA_START=139 /DNA_END=879 /DNA_ORIENTATION=+